MDSAEMASCITQFVHSLCTISVVNQHNTNNRYSGSNRQSHLPRLARFGKSFRVRLFDSGIIKGPRIQRRSGDGL